MRIKPFLLALLAVSALSTNAAHANLIKNGNFDETTNGGNKQLAGGTSTTRADRTTLKHWESGYGEDGRYNFVLNGDIAHTGQSAISLRDKYADTGLSNGYSASPTGGNFFASDWMYFPGPLKQQVNGLTIGDSYTLTFDFALAQQVIERGPNNNNFWEVDFGGAKQNSELLSIVDSGFSGWKTATMTFTASSASQWLSFMVHGSGAGAPPFMLLDNVALNAEVPEPATLGMLLGGLGLIGFTARRRNRSGGQA
jgi:hypothetical protein